MFGQIVAAGLFVAIMSSTAAAQNWSFDARRIALGGIGDTGNVARQLVDEQRGYGTIVVPFGLLQVLGDLSIYDPGDDGFDPVRTAEYLASPLHYTIDRNGSDSGQQFVNDLVNAQLSPNLNVYRGFVPASEQFGEGLAAPTWGRTFALRNDGNSFHGIYVGAGPYLSVRTDNVIDQGLIDLLASDVDVFEPNASFLITDNTVDQLALAVTGGYRGRFPFPGRSSGGSERDGMYIAVNYHYLNGFHYDDFDMAIRFDTDALGLATVAPTTVPISIERLTADRGRGFALDFGLAFVMDRWDVGFGATGVANRIEWEAVEQERFLLTSVFDGGDFVETPSVPLGEDRRIELPVHYTGDVAYHEEAWSAYAEYARGFQDNNFRGGLEYRLGRVELRGGGRFTQDRWHGTGGVGLDVSPGWSVDVGAFGTSTNIERTRHVAIAVSLRLNPTDSSP
jgi:hypothetical protein